MATTRDDRVKALYLHISKCAQCGKGTVPVPNADKCAEGRRLAQVFTVR
jgi:hypothetical protein